MLLLNHLENRYFISYLNLDAISVSTLDLIRGDSLEVLNVSGCEITAAGGLSLVEVLSSGCIKFETLRIDISNNDLGKAGEIQPPLILRYSNHHKLSLLIEKSETRVVGPRVVGLD